MKNYFFIVLGFMAVMFLSMIGYLVYVFSAIDTPNDYKFFTTLNKDVYSVNDTIEISLEIEDPKQRGICLRNGDSYTSFLIESENDHSFNETLFEKDRNYYGVFENIDDKNIKLYETSGNEKIKEIYHGRFIKINDEYYLKVMNYNSLKIKPNEPYLLSCYWRPVVDSIINQLLHADGISENDFPAHQAGRFILKEEN